MRPLHPLSAEYPAMHGCIPEEAHRLEVLRMVRVSLGGDLDAFDTIRLTHYVITGTELPMPGAVYSTAAETVYGA